MKTFSLALLPLLAACAMHTPINQLTLPDASTIHGTVVEVEDAETFVLEDATGRIEVEWEGEDLSPALTVGEMITVSGVVDEDESIGEDAIFAEEFDAFCVKRADGTVVSAVPVCGLK